MLEIGIPDFTELDTKVEIGKTSVSLRDFCFDLKDSAGTNLFVDVDDATRSGITVFQVSKEDKHKVMESINAWIQKQFKMHIQWNSDHQFEAKTYRLDSKHRSLANQFSELAFASLPKATQSSEKPPSASKMKNVTPLNAWVDLTRVREPPSHSSQSKNKEATLDDDATVTTLTDSTWQSIANAARAETKEKFKTIGRNVRQLSYRHKKVEVGQECLEMSVALKLNQLFRCFEVHHNRLERLEEARDRHLAIQLQHLHYTLDPVAAEKDGTLTSLKKLLSKESKASVKDKAALKEDIIALEGEHEEDREFVEKEERAGWLFHYYHQKIVDSEDEEFDIRNLSDVSDEETATSKTIIDHDLPVGASIQIQDTDTDEDVTMQDAITDHDPITQDESYNKTQERSVNTPVNQSPAAPTNSWYSSDEDGDENSLTFSFSPPVQPTWTTPSRPLRKTQNSPLSKAQTSITSKKVVNPSRVKARNLMKKVFSSDTSNRFSALTEETLPHNEILNGTSMDNEEPFDEIPQESSQLDSEYDDMTSADDISLDDMSLVSNSEMQDLEDDLKDLVDDEGYDTETTDNTSPRKKPYLEKKRKSSITARTRISQMYSSTDNPNVHPRAREDQNPASFPISPSTDSQPTRATSTQTSPSSPHPSLNTLSHSEGSGAGKS
jgi:hypothetical protein